MIAAVRNHVDMLLEVEDMDVDKKSRKRSLEESNEAPSIAGLMKMKKIGKTGGSKSERLLDSHPFYSLPVDLQLDILELPDELIKEVLEELEKETDYNNMTGNNGDY